MASTTESTRTSGGAGGPGTGVTHGAPAALGKVTAARDGIVVFAPAGTNYELQLAAPNYNGPLNTPVKGLIRLTARKVWTVPSGGNFVEPIFGRPRIIQGRVRVVEPRQLLVQAGCPIWVDLPDNDIVYDLANGPIRAGSIVNVSALPAATFRIQNAE